MPSPDLALSARDFDFVCRLVYERSRICLGPDKQPLVFGRLVSRLRSLGCRDFAEYCGRLATPACADEVDHLIDLITTNHTRFFRERAHFELLVRQMLPQIAARSVVGGRPLRIWSAAAASGEEPYSLAIVLAEFARSQPLPGWHVYASDISRRMVDRCRLGIYEAAKVELPSADMLPRYFRCGVGPREGYYRVKPEIRRSVTAQMANLFGDADPIPEDVDVVFCRNVMIYFDTASRAELVARLFDRIASGGYLVIGHAESLIGLRHRFRQIAPSVFMRAS